MITRPTTDEIAASIRTLTRANPAVTEVARPVAHDLATELQLCLPYLDPADIAAVLMHTSSCISGLIARFRAEGIDDFTTATIAANTMAIAGEQMDRKARRPGRPDTTDTTGT